MPFSRPLVASARHVEEGWESPPILPDDTVTGIPRFKVKKRGFVLPATRHRLAPLLNVGAASVAPLAVGTMVTRHAQWRRYGVGCVGLVDAPGGGAYREGRDGASPLHALPMVHNDSHGAPLRHLLAQQQIGRSTAPLRPSTGRHRSNQPPLHRSPSGRWSRDTPNGGATG